jgi:hypothetical protein
MEHACPELVEEAEAEDTRFMLVIEHLLKQCRHSDGHSLCLSVETYVFFGGDYRLRRLLDGGTEKRPLCPPSCLIESAQSNESHFCDTTPVSSVLHLRGALLIEQIYQSLINHIHYS